MNQEDIQKALEAIAKGGISVNGDLVIEKHVDNEVGNVEAGGIGIQINHGTTLDASEMPENERFTKWEDTIPEYLRTGKWATAWQRLKEHGFVDENCHRTEKMTGLAAAYIVSHFEKPDGTSPWTFFEDFWGLKNMRQTKQLPAKSVKEEIDSIFTKLL